MKLLQKTSDKIVFVAESDESLVNAIRRYVNEIPVLAIDEVEISKNDSALYDETIAHRLGLIPLKTDKSFDEKTVIKLKLVSKKPGYVYSGELKGKAEVVYKDIPITILNQNQELEFIAEAKIGKGNEHSKFSPGLIFYRNVADVKVEKDCSECKECFDACPKNVFKIENKKIIIDKYKCDMCEACIESCKKQGKDAISVVPTNELIVSIESFGQISIKEILNGSIKELKKDFAGISKKVSET